MCCGIRLFRGILHGKSRKIFNRLYRLLQFSGEILCHVIGGVIKIMCNNEFQKRNISTPNLSYFIQPKSSLKGSTKCHGLKFRKLRYSIRSVWIPGITNEVLLSSKNSVPTEKNLSAWVSHILGRKVISVRFSTYRKKK